MKLRDLLNSTNKKIKLNESWGEQETPKMSNEDKRAFLESVGNFNSFGESIYRENSFQDMSESIGKMLEQAKHVALQEGDWFDGVTVGRHMKGLGESYKIFEKTAKEMSILQQRMEACYEDMGGTLGKYFDINDVEEGNAFGAAVSKAKKDGDDSFEVDGEKYDVTESVNEGLSVTDEKHVGKKGIIIMIDDNGKKVSAIFKNKKNADKYNRNKASDLKVLLDLAKKTPYPKAIDELHENTSVPTPFAKAFDRIPESKITKDIIRKLAKKFGVSESDAIAYTYEATDIDLKAIDESVIYKNEPKKIKFPSWVKSFRKKLANRFQVEERDLRFKMVHPHLMGVDTFNFSQEGSDSFPKDCRTILRLPEFKGKATFTFDGTGKIEDRLVKKHPELEDYFDDEEHYWIYIK